MKVAWRSISTDRFSLDTGSISKVLWCVVFCAVTPNFLNRGRGKERERQSKEVQCIGRKVERFFLSRFVRRRQVIKSSWAEIISHSGSMGGA